MSDRIILKGLRYFARHGVFAGEGVGQRFELDVTAGLDLRPGATSDDHARTLCYGELARVVGEAFTGRRFNLIEAAAEAVAVAVLGRFPEIAQVVVEVRKPSAPVEAILDHVAVVITRTRAVPGEAAGV